MDWIAISGASGMVATELISRLLSLSEYGIYAITRSEGKLARRYSEEQRVRACSLQGFPEVLGDRHLEAVVHCAFARSADPACIAESIAYGAEFMSLCANLKVKSFLNISSQSVYGNTEPAPWDESSTIAPNYLYSLGKYASEQLAKHIFEGTGVNYTNIRLSSISENARFLSVFCKNAMSGHPIVVQEGNRAVSFLDVRDAASGIAKVIDCSAAKNLKPVYNLSSGRQRTIGELAEDVRRLALKYGKTVEIEYLPSNGEISAGMSAELFKEEFSWEPRFDYDDMITSLLEFHGGGSDFPVSFRRNGSG